VDRGDRLGKSPNPAGGHWAGGGRALGLECPQHALSRRRGLRRLRLGQCPEWIWRPSLSARPPSPTR
jgi:hypothetical protein